MKRFAIAIVICTYLEFYSIGAAEKVTYISLERVKITHTNTKFILWANCTTRRFSRTDPRYYFDLHFVTNVTMDDNIGVDFHFYEWLSNSYKRSFVEFHFRACDMLSNDKIFGSAMRQGKLSKPCPYPPDTYNLYNMTIPPTAIPPHFPFTKGRIYTNFTYLPTKESISGGYADMEVKTLDTRKAKKKVK